MESKQSELIRANSANIGAIKLELAGGEAHGLRPYVFETAWEVANKGIDGLFKAMLLNVAYA